jgi:hypothetical protein
MASLHRSQLKVSKEIPQEINMAGILFMLVQFGPAIVFWWRTRLFMSRPSKSASAYAKISMNKKERRL